MPTIKRVATLVLDISIVSALGGSIFRLVSATDGDVSKDGPITQIALGCFSTALIQVIGKMALPGLFKRLNLQKSLPAELELRNQGKFEEMFMALILLSISSFYLFDVFESTDWIWWKDQTLMYTGPSFPIETKTNNFYLITVGTWITNAFCMRFIEEKNRDWLLMYTHHALTIALICGSYLISMERVGCMILFIHQVSDIVLNICQFTHYLGWDAEHFPFHIPVAEILFAINIVSWIYSRLYILPKYCTSSVFTYMQENEYCSQDGNHFCNLLGSFLCALQVMHVWWLYEMLLVAYKILTGVKSEDAARSYLDP
eukprot:CAMPEP_0118656528 /NCGR_PEP_ID=MMETSP0785-20121206/13536_1 /TAXON_ID=91992 /ORGANISM="Bolidomonas pacifica, Strain CCMP 1866" /LENGTH=314 /DNA_ID=CAMNT_0006549391 /DNA_START=119 /DNA_END=1059 /DNA_ORIENTATION=-